MLSRNSYLHQLYEILHNKELSNENRDLQIKQVVQSMKELNLSFDVYEIHDMTNLLMYAIDKHYVDIVKTCLEQGLVDPNYPNSSGMMALHFAVIKEDVEMARLLLEAKADPNFPDPIVQEHTPLHLAIKNNKNVELAKLLLASGADANYHVQPLIIAIQQQRPDMVEILLEKKADPNAIELETGFVPLLWAIQKNNPQIINLLLKQGASPTMLLEPFTNLLLKALIMPIPLEKKNQRIDLIIKLIYPIFFNNEAKEKEENIASLQATLKNHLEFMPFLLHIGMNPERLMKQLIQLLGNTLENHQVPLLVKNQQAHFLIEAMSKLPIQISSNTEILQMMSHVFGFAVELGYVEVVKKMLETVHPNPNIADANNQLPISLSVKTKNPEMVKLLLDAKANPNVSDRGLSEITPLLLAVQTGNADVLKMLLENGAQPNHFHKEIGMTPLIAAVRSGKLKLVQLLLEKNADPDAISALTNTTALSEAICYNHPLIVDALLKANANINLLGNTSKTALFAMLPHPETPEKYDRQMIEAMGAILLKDRLGFYDKTIKNMNKEALYEVGAYYIHSLRNHAKPLLPELNAYLLFTYTVQQDAAKNLPTTKLLHTQKSLESEDNYYASMSQLHADNFFTLKRNKPGSHCMEDYFCIAKALAMTDFEKFGDLIQVNFSEMTTQQALNYQQTVLMALKQYKKNELVMPVAQPVQEVEEKSETQIQKLTRLTNKLKEPYLTRKEKAQTNYDVSLIIFAIAQKADDMNTKINWYKRAFQQCREAKNNGHTMTEVSALENDLKAAYQEAIKTQQNSVQQLSVQGKFAGSTHSVESVNPSVPDNRLNSPKKK